jgi:hypothetical protein
LFGSYLYIVGYSYSSGLSLGGTDIFILQVLKSTGTLSWGKHIGTFGYSEYSNRLTVGPSGNVYLTGKISSPTFI